MYIIYIINNNFYLGFLIQEFGIDSTLLINIVKQVYTDRPSLEGKRQRVPHLTGQRYRKDLGSQDRDVQQTLCFLSVSVKRKLNSTSYTLYYQELRQVSCPREYNRRSHRSENVGKTYVVVNLR